MKNFRFVLPSIFLAYASWANASDCANGDLVERTAQFKEIVQIFSFSKNCLLQNEGEKIGLLKGSGYVNLEVYWPGLISHSALQEFSRENGLPANNQGRHIRAFVTLSYGPNPLMISSAVDAYYSQRKHQQIKEDANYSYFQQKSRPGYEVDSTKNKTIFIAPKHIKDFWVMCMKNQCIVNGIEGTVKYEINLQSSDQLDWVNVHQTMVTFIKNIYVGIK